MGKNNLIIGIHPVLEALKSGKEIDRVIFQKGLRSDGFKEIYALMKELGIPSQTAPLQKLQRITGKNHQGVIAFSSPIEYQNLDNILSRTYEEGETPLILALDGLTDVRNFGAITRTAECNKVHAIVIPSKGFAQINEAAIKSSAGAMLKVNICRSDYFSKSLKKVQQNGIQIIACTEKGDCDIQDIDFSLPTCIVMGNEETGISNDVLRFADKMVRIPMYGSIQSLNVSVATGVTLYEVNRQRKINELI